MKTPALIKKLVKINDRFVVALDSLVHRIQWPQFGKKPNKIRWSSYSWFIAGGLGLLLVLVGLAWWFYPKHEAMRVANLASRSFSVVWMTNNPGKGCVLAMRYGLPVNFIWECGPPSSQAHLVTLKNLRPNTRYVMMGWQWGLPAWRSPLWVTTLSEREDPPLLPRPAYGTVYGENEERLVNVLVYVYTMTNQPQYPVAALTNDTGNYAVNMANLMRLGDSFVVEGHLSPEVWSRNEADSRYMTPLPPLHLRRYR